MLVVLLGVGDESGINAHHDDPILPHVSGLKCPVWGPQQAPR